MQNVMTLRVDVFLTGAFVTSSHKRLRALLGRAISTLVVGVFFLSPSFADEHLPGGLASTPVTGHNAYSMPSHNMSMSRRLDFSVGNSFFRNPWVSAPATTDARDGLGPLFNTNSCQGCHIKDGRGHMPDSEHDSATSMLVRLSLPGQHPEPNYGHQIQDLALPNLAPEASIRIRWKDEIFTYPDGETASLRQPELSLDNLAYGALSPDTRTSIRVAPPMIGLGLLEAIPLSALKALADPEDANQDGISGKLNQVWNVSTQQNETGRFGWKAGQPSLAQQNAAAFRGDLGLSTSLFPGDDCQASQTQCLKAPSGGSPEVSDKILSFVEFYTRNLAVPMRSEDAVTGHQRGKALFEKIQCAACHQPKFVTAQLPNQPEQSEQIIWPYTDLLLHDMGSDLADGHEEFLAGGHEWRTPPLWGLSQLNAVNGHTQLLHDGRARNVEEAILWHGGEARSSRQQFTQLSKQEREALIDFVSSL